MRMATPSNLLVLLIACYPVHWVGIYCINSDEFTAPYNGLFVLLGMAFYQIPILLHLLAAQPKPFGYRSPARGLIRY
jgi:hypothetical protein